MDFQTLGIHSINAVNGLRGSSVVADSDPEQSRREINCRWARSTPLRPRWGLFLNFVTTTCPVARRHQRYFLLRYALLIAGNARQHYAVWQNYVSKATALREIYSLSKKCTIAYWRRVHVSKCTKTFGNFPRRMWSTCWTCDISVHSCSAEDCCTVQENKSVRA